MRGAARKPAEEPAPAKADLDARLAGVLDGQMELVTRATALLDRCPDPRLLRQLITEVIGWGLHAEEMREEMARYTAANAGGDSFFELGRAYERTLLQDAAAKAAVPGPRHSRRSRLRDVPGQVALFSVKVVAIGAGLGAAALKVFGKASRHAPVHTAGIKLTTLKAAALATAIPAAGALVITGAVVFSHPSGAHGSGPGQGAAPAASVYAGTPIPSSSLIARTVTHPKPKHGKKQLMASGLPLLCCTEDSQPSASASSSAAPSPSASVQVGPAQLSLGGVTSLDLSNPLIPQVTLTLSATGAGWVSWKIDTAGTDLDFSKTSGVLAAGQSITVTVSVDPAQALNGNVSQTFEVNGNQVTVGLPALVPAVVPTGVAPSDILPSL